MLPACLSRHPQSALTCRGRSFLTQPRHLFELKMTYDRDCQNQGWAADCGWPGYEPCGFPQKRPPESCVAERSALYCRAVPSVALALVSPQRQASGDPPVRGAGSCEQRTSAFSASVARGIREGIYSRGRARQRSLTSLPLSRAHVKSSGSPGWVWQWCWGFSCTLLGLVTGAGHMRSTIIPTGPGLELGVLAQCRQTAMRSAVSR